jgi:hypothetical protein
MRLEIVVETGDDVCPNNVDVAIAIRATLFVPESDGVAYFMNSIPGGAIGAQVDILNASLHPNA